MRRLGKVFKHLLFPPKCSACGELLEWYTHTEPDALCPDCRKQWESEKLDTCGICAKRVTECECLTAELEKAKCKSFRKLVFYQHGKGERVQNRLIFHMKKQNDRQTPHFLASELLPMLPALTAVDGQAVLTYVPRARTTALKYGTDQALELANALSELSGLPCEKLISRHARNHVAQKELSPAERLRNAKETFYFSRRAEAKGKNVILIDDIVTTGATAATCVRLLRRAGAKAVFCIAVASDDVNK
ncbi:MAG: ComF family protein [Clostridia bacterium]|nr:ComF family protein [Clostridia bacterium]